ncbi:hypothetical protein [Corallococcus sicarius]|uniref:hypothetical protein n=1 Tax=Corallococcus sicarius TaxID=2316726 RepID=UPI0011C4827C|nr:hypothetical protein [Corallococcus sicarius]
MGAVTPEPGSPWVWVLGGDGNIWANAFYGPGGWCNLGAPPGVNVTEPLGVLVVANGMQYGYVLGSDGQPWMTSGPSVPGAPWSPMGSAATAAQKRGAWHGTGESREAGE